jgi:hypothetical protein
VRSAADDPRARGKRGRAAKESRGKRGNGGENGRDAAGNGKGDALDELIARMSRGESDEAGESREESE